MTRSTRWTHATRRRVRAVYEVLGDHPTALPLLLAATPESIRSRWVTSDTDLVVEGFPRSGNTYAALGIAITYGGAIRVVSHAHVPAQVKRAVRLGVPTILVVREPEATVCSMAVADRHHRVRDLLSYWIHYHEQLLPLTDRIVVAPFETVTEDLGRVIESLNQRYETNFGALVGDPPAREQVFEAIEAKQRAVHGEQGYHAAVPRPDFARAEASARRRAELATTVREADLRRAHDLHQRLVGPR